MSTCKKTERGDRKRYEGVQRGNVALEERQRSAVQFLADWILISMTLKPCVWQEKGNMTNNNPWSRKINTHFSEDWSIEWFILPLWIFHLRLKCQWLSRWKEKGCLRQRERNQRLWPSLYLYHQRQQSKISGTKTHVTLAISVGGAT